MCPTIGYTHQNGNAIDRENNDDQTSWQKSTASLLIWWCLLNITVDMPKTSAHHLAHIIYVYINVYIYTRVYIYIYIMRIYIYIYIMRIYIYMHACMHACMHAHIHTSTQAYMHTHPYTHTCTLLYRCIDVCMHTVLCNVPLCGGQRGLKLRELMEKWSIDGCFNLFLPVQHGDFTSWTASHVFGYLLQHTCMFKFICIYIHI